MYNAHIIDYFSAMANYRAFGVRKSLTQMCVETRAAFGLDRGNW